MLQAEETFFTRVGCMDGRIQVPLRIYGQKVTGAEYPDTISDPGAAGILAGNPSQEFLARLKSELDISLGKHHSRGIIVHGHQDCAGHPVDDETHKEDVRKSVEIIRKLTNNEVPVYGVFVKRDGPDWIVEEV